MLLLGLLACVGPRAPAADVAPMSASDALDAARHAAVAGDRDGAFAHLTAAARAGYADPDALVADPDLASLQRDARWGGVASRVLRNRDTAGVERNAELEALYRADQAERKDGTFTAERDAVRLARVQEILAAGGAKSSADLYHAAMVHQHGGRLEHYETAHALALRALEVQPVHEPARWLAAAAEDRALMHRGLPQRWGTQFTRPPGEPWELWPVDPTVTDDERARWNVKPLAVQRKRVDELNARDGL